MGPILKWARICVSAIFKWSGICVNPIKKKREKNEQVSVRAQL